jgi:hypothetical protein
MKKLLCILTLVFILFVQMGLTQTPIAIKGVAIDSDGMPIANGNKLITFAIYESREGTTSIWSEQQEVVVEDGYFIAQLGAINDLDLSFEDARWLGLKIGDGEEMKPRIKVNKMGGDFTMSQKRRIVTDAGKGRENAVDMDGAAATTESVTAPGAPPDQVILDDLIVDGSICVGQDCNNGESFGFDTIRLKENNLRIRFVDTSNTSSFPSRDWQITVNESANGGKNKFSIDDIDGGRTPFTIEGGAPANALYVEDSGRIGLGTSTPVVELQVNDGDTPTLRLEQDGSSGYTPQTWDVAGNEANFFIRDATNGSQLSFRIQPNTPGNFLSLRNTNGGRLGIGTWDPTEKLHVHNGNIKIHDTSWNTGDPTQYGILFSDGTFQTTAATGGGGGGLWTQSGSDIYYNTGNVGIRTTTPQAMLHVQAQGFADAALVIDHAMYSANDNLKWSLSQDPFSGNLGIFKHTDTNGISGGLVFEVRTNGDVYVGGNLAHSSDVRYKKNIQTLSYALDKVTRLRGVEFDWRNGEFQNKTFSKDHQIGFIAQEVEDVIPELVKTDSDGYKAVSYSNVTALLVEAIKDQQKIIIAQENELRTMKTKLAEIELILNKLPGVQTIRNTEPSLQKTNVKIQNVNQIVIEQKTDENGRPIGSIQPSKKNEN